MPGNLESSLAGIPIYRALLAQRQFDQNQQGGALSNLLRQQQVDQGQRGLREEEELKGVLSQTRGDPERAIKALMTHGSPKAVELATKLRGLVPKPGLQQIGTGLYDPQTGKTVAPPARPGAETASQPEIIKLQQFAESLPPGHPGRKKIEARINVLSTRPEKLAPQNRPLPSPLQKQLTEVAELADATDRFDSTFQDSYGGKTITGELSNVKGKYFGDDTGQSQWWQDYELHQSQVRNKLFGSALTAPEIAAWEKSAINPRMEQKQIRANLARRKELEQRAINRLMRGAAVTYNKEQIEAFTGRSIDSGTPTQPTQPTGPKRLKFDANGNPIP